MSLKDLTKVVIPPAKPVYAGNHKHWNAIEKSIGIEFPDDYYEIARTYGSGEFLAGTLEIANPFDPEFEQWVQYELAKLRDYRVNSLDELPYSIFPEPDGLFPFGRDDNGNRFFWETRGRPNNWPIICRSEAYHWESINHLLSNFLLLLITNKLDINRTAFWGDSFPEKDWVFKLKR